jgi:pimeloyl-ACP methyl ester carboxylesterase
MVKGPYAHREDLRALLDSLGTEWAFLVGCSMGGGTIIDFALEHPGRVRALVLVGSAVSGFESGDDSPEQWEELVAAEDAGDLGRVCELEVQIWVDGPYRGPDRVDPGVRDLVREMNLIALKNEASGLGDERPLDLGQPWTGWPRSRFQRLSSSATTTGRGSSGPPISWRGAFRRRGEP